MRSVVTRAGWLCAVLLAWLPLPVAAQQAEADVCAPFSAQNNRAPSYPVDELWRLLGYTVNVIIETGACGRVGDARVESTSGVPALDAVALDAARGWTVAPEYRGQPRYRLPFAFEPLPEPIAVHGNVRRRDPFFTERSSGRVPTPNDLQGSSLPGYINDPYPIGYMTGQQLMEVLAPIALFRLYGEWGYFWLHDEEGLNLFQVSRDLIVRNRLVNDGTRQFVVSSALCPMELEPCRAHLSQLQAGRGRQVAQSIPVSAP